MSDFDRFVSYLKFMGVTLDSSSFDSRIRMQKLAYLLGILSGKPFSMDFSTYIRGPYSRELADYYYKNNFSIKNPKIDESFKKELARVGFVKGLSTRQLEIMATLQRLMELGNDEDATLKKIRKMKPYLNMDEIINGLNNLKQFMLKEKDRKRILNALKEEFQLYDNTISDGIIEP